MPYGESMMNPKLLSRAQEIARIEGIPLAQALEQLFTAAVRRAKYEGERIGTAQGRRAAEEPRNVAALLHTWAACYDDEDARQVRDVAGLLEEKEPPYEQNRRSPAR